MKCIPLKFLTILLFSAFVFVPLNTFSAEKLPPCPEKEQRPLNWTGWWMNGCYFMASSFRVTLSLIQWLSHHSMGLTKKPLTMMPK